jgi:hypothetical protein
MFTHNDTAVNLNDSDFFFAFGVRNYLKNEYKDDPDYVQWKVKVFEGNGEEPEITHTILTHRCDETEWKKFHKPLASDKKKMEKLKSKKTLHCLNDLDIEGKPYSRKIYGPDDGRDHRRFDIMLLPCELQQIDPSIN